MSWGLKRQVTGFTEWPPLPSHRALICSFESPWMSHYLWNGGPTGGCDPGGRWGKAWRRAHAPMQVGHPLGQINPTVPTLRETKQLEGWGTILDLCPTKYLMVRLKARGCKGDAVDKEPSIPQHWPDRKPRKELSKAPLMARATSMRVEDQTPGPDLSSNGPGDHWGPLTGSTACEKKHSQCKVVSYSVSFLLFPLQ